MWCPDPGLIPPELESAGHGSRDVPLDHAGVAQLAKAVFAPAEGPFATGHPTGVADARHYLGIAATVSDRMWGGPVARAAVAELTVAV